MTITEEGDVTTTTMTVGGVEVPAPPEGLPFTYLSSYGDGSSLGERFDASLAQARAEAYAALAEEQAAFLAANRRAHTRLDIYQYGRASAPVPVFTAAEAASIPQPEPEQEPVAEEALPPLPEAKEEAMGNFLAAHDAEDAREAEAAPETCPAGPVPGEVPLLRTERQLDGPPHRDAGRTQVKDRPGTQPDEDAPEAEPGTEDEEPAEAAGPEAPDDGEPASVQDEAPAPVAEISDPAPQDEPDPTD